MEYSKSAVSMATISNIFLNSSIWVISLLIYEIQTQVIHQIDTSREVYGIGGNNWLSWLQGCHGNQECPQN